MTTDYSIRTATPDDAKELVAIYDYYVKETAITFEYETPSIEEFRGRIEKVLQKYPYIVIEKGKEILGYAYASTFKDRDAYQWSVELSIYLAKDARRAGLGRMLYEELEKRLKAQGILNLYACIGYPDDEDEHLTLDSVKFHERLGYSMIGKFNKCGYKFGTWYSMVWMEKLIGEHK
ncbi:GNAT family N-acetyltransferase [Butyrivibrio sp. XPD2006]|uniref:GNAT family N-acetyltransferase n=1 Tax=Butyrivibrio sp. XPD2006 TaxID=1280668 RepID=UPI0003B468F6|nr:GNAT family N-acetyltransferase [Butyrivibrio sp. XPD2006]